MERDVHYQPKVDRFPVDKIGQDDERTQLCLWLQS